MTFTDFCLSVLISVFAVFVLLAWELTHGGYCVTAWQPAGTRVCIVTEVR